jgi:hypothetical protein
MSTTRPSWAPPRFAFVVLAFVATIVAFSLANTHSASAQFYNGFDPAGTAVSFINNNEWLTKAQGWARQIYLGLIIFEVIALGITTLLFRDNLGEFFASLCLKLVMGSVFFWFISVAGPGITQLPGEVVTQTFGNTFGKGLGGTDDVAGLATDGLGAAASFFTASYGMRAADGVAASVVEGTTVAPNPFNPVNCTQVYAGPVATGGGTCLEQPARTVAFGREAAENVTSGLGMMVGMAVAAIYLQYTMITIETYFVMTVGILFVGFAATRFTTSFSQGYFSYMISVGAKLMVFYMILGIVGPMVTGILEDSIGALVTAIIDPTGLSTLALGLYAALSVVIFAGLVYAAPGFAASMLSGQSSVSGSALASQAMRSIAGGAQLMGSMAQASQNRKEMVADEKELAADRSADRKGAAPSGDMSPAGAGSKDSFQSAGAGTSGSAGAAPGGSQSNSVLGDTLGMQRPGEQGLKEKIKAEREQSDMSMGYAAGAVANAAPQDTTQPAAVQVRVGTPDRL